MPHLELPNLHIPTFWVPVLLVTHGMVFARLLKRVPKQSENHVESPAFANAGQS